jgi:hypothetical protein
MRIAASMRRGDLVEAYDIARREMAQARDARPFAYASVLCLARSGATGFAFDEYRRLGLDRVEDDERIGALGGRLLKDMALQAGGEERTRIARASADAYAGVARRFGSDYGAINAATMALVAGARARASEQAAGLLTRLAQTPSDGEVAYFEAATTAEAHLLLGDVVAASDALRSGIALAPDQHAAHAATIRQMELICGELAIGDAWLDDLRPPVCAHFTGHIFAFSSLMSDAAAMVALDARIAQALADHRVGCAFGSLAAGADVLVAEAVLRAGLELHVVLPLDQKAFLAVSVAPFGDGWLPRVEACLERASSIRHASQDPYLGDDRVFAYASQYAIGCAVLKARAIATRAVQLAVWDGQPTGGLGGVASDVEHWRSIGREPVVIPVGAIARPATGVDDALPAGPISARATKAMLFADFQGFGRLRDDQVPAFFEVVMEGVAATLAALAVQPWLVETWGDGLFLVFDTPGSAAEAALRIIEAHGVLDLAAHGLPDGLGIRIAGHYGPVHIRTNPILKTKSAVGTHVVVAARIEPDVAPGSLYVSEAFAGAVAAAQADRYRCGYVGRSTERKSCAPMPLFSVTRR